VDGDVPEFVPPRVLGHEPLGTIEWAGEDVVGFAPGTRVTWEPSLPCGTCFYCRQGEDGICERRIPIVGAFSERTIVPARALHHVPDEVPPEIGVLSEPVSCALYAHDRGGVRPGDRVAVIGAGTIGLLLVALARRAGARYILVSDPNPRKRALAAQMGADAVVDPAREDPVEVGRRATTGRGVEVSFEAVGLPATVGHALRSVRPGGRAVLVGIPPAAATAAVPLFEVLRQDLTVHAVWMRRYTYQRAIDLLALLPLQGLVTNVMPLERIGDAFAILRAGESVKVAVAP